MVGGAGLVLGGAAIGFALDANAASDALRGKCGADLVCDEDPGFDPAPLNARKNRGVGLAIGLGSASVIAIGAAVVGLVSRPSHSARIELAPWFSARGAGVGAFRRF